MKKILYALLALFIVLLIALYTILFTTFGNNIIANIAQDKAKMAGLDLNISEFKLRTSSLSLNAKLANLLDINLNGDISIFSLKFNLSYLLSFDKDNAKNLGLNLDKNIDFNGSIVGKLSDFNVDGEGLLIGSNTKLDTRIYKYSPIALKIDANNLKIEKLLSLLSKPNYANGVLDINANIVANNLQPDGSAVIKLNTTSINYVKIKEDFNITLPKNSNPKAEINANIKDNKINILSKIYNDYLNFQTQNTDYDLANSTLNSDFSLQIPNLAKLESLTKTKLNGNLNINGDLSLQNNTLTNLNVNINGLGRKAEASLKDSILNVLLEQISLDKLLGIIGYGNLATGVLNANLQSIGLDFQNFNAKADVKNGKLNSNGLKEFIGLEFPSMSFNLDANAKANKGLIDYEAVISSNLLNIKEFKGSYDLNSMVLKFNTQANIDDLSKINNNIKGALSLNANGDIANNEIKSLNAKAVIADGVLNINSNGKTLDLEASKLDITKILSIIGMPTYASGSLNAKANLTSLDFNNLNGNADIKANGLLNASVLSKLLDKKFPSNTNYDLNAKITLKNSLANFESVLNTDLAKMSNLNGSFDLNKMLLNSTYKLNISDLSKLGFLLDRKLSGKLDLNGKLNFNKSLDLTAMSDNFYQGKLDSNLKNNIINAKLENVDFSSLAKGFDFTDIYESKANANATYNLNTQKGEVSLNLNNGKLKKSTITNALNIIISKDITTDVYHTANANANINKSNISFNLNMKADRSDIVINSGKINTDSGSLNIPFSAKIDRADFNGSITGTTQNPKISLDTSSIAKTITNVITDSTKSNTKELKEEIGKSVDKLLKKLF
ncbi:hypothetical protein FMM58_00145 [Campylobacter sp. LR291e]|uniref:hypothetical protein n=1 Tax=unclassified Campylobacter TaxID=2593542 RepID=UPI001237D697|nr:MULTISPECIES: hypothetical protein [unclassified Campylobacter]KAA6225450.1 hypothetical protein FMM55_06500 [Campylobacter sp. LR196d]KAA6228802.1 hypothetical protein FMM54_00165 [Campylobacter sp. LR185c]KAA6234246.1 hypothetical protein FMM58_00145 [Campylobacter sp. LR291e]KAA8604145.1 hypothetical protein CGP82_04320 [Campylobacter sp. LR185c]